MKENKKAEKLQSRREFFKKAAKGALPILGAIAMADVPALVKAAENPMGCGSYGDCNASCMISCRSCSFGCSGNCDSSCKGGCQGSCYTGCLQSCHGTCSGGCARSAYA